MIKIDCLKGPDNKHNYTQLEQESVSLLTMFQKTLEINYFKCVNNFQHIQALPVQMSL